MSLFDAIPGMGCGPGMADVPFGAPLVDPATLVAHGSVFDFSRVQNPTSEGAWGSFSRNGLSGLGSSPQVQMVLAAAQAVHMDVSQGVSLDRARADLVRAGQFLDSVSVTDPDYPVAQQAVSSAQLDYENLASHQGGAAFAQQGFLSASGAQQNYFGTGGQPIDVGSGGGDFYDTVGGSVGLDNLNKFLNVAGGGVPGADQARCLSTGGTWNSQAQVCVGGTAWCDAAPSPFNLACKHPVGTVLVVGGVILAPWIIPWLVKLVSGVRSVA